MLANLTDLIDHQQPFTPLFGSRARARATSNIRRWLTRKSVAVAVICIPRGWIWQGASPAVVMFGRFGRRNAGAYDDRRNALVLFLGFDADSGCRRRGLGSLTAFAVFRMGLILLCALVIAGICSIIAVRLLCLCVRARAESVGVACQTRYC